MSDTQMLAAVRSVLGPVLPTDFFVTNDEMISAVVELEDLFNIEITDETLDEHNVQTVGQLIALADRLHEEKLAA